MWLYTLPVAVALPLFVGVFVGVSLLIVLVLRRLVPHDPNRSSEWDRVLGYVVAVYGVLYGVTLALIAAASYENYRGVEELVLAETSSIAVLYRDASGFPEPTRSELQTLLVEYAEHVIEVDWVTQGAGEIPSSTVQQVTDLQRVLFAFEPEDDSESNLHLATIGALNDFISARGSRIGVTGLELPGILWLVLYVGAIINAILIGLIEVRRLRTHLLMAGLVAGYVAIVIFSIASFDHVYEGEVSVDTTYFDELREWLFTDPG